MATTETTLNGNGTAGPFTYTFPALEAGHINVSVDDVAKTVNVDYSLDFANSQITFLNTPYPTVSEVIRIYRDTNDDALSASFYSGAAIRANDLNNNFNQALYIAQETKAITVQASTGNLADGSITNNLLAAGAVTTTKIVDSNVTTAKLADGSVTTSKIADSNVTEAKLAFTPVKTTDIGTTVQAYDVDTAKTDVAQSFTAQQTFKELKETVYTLAGTAIDPANGSVQTKTLSAPVTFTETLESGQTVVLMIEGGATHAITWPTITWVSLAGNTAPTLTAKDTFVLWKTGSTLYGAYVGSYV